jgi:branched-chain amino acid aminotransferase
MRGWQASLTESRNDHRSEEGNGMTIDSNPRRHLWLNGELVGWEDATVHITALGSLLTIATVGEGIRAYWNSRTQRLFVFRLYQHMQRFDNSMKLQRMQRVYTPEQLSDAVVDLLRVDSSSEDTTISPRAFYDPFGSQGPFVEDPASAQVMIWADHRPSRLASPEPIHCCVSSWTRQSDNMVPPRIKGLSNYQNNRLAAWEAHQNGYDEAILLNSAGKVTEAPAACIFMVRDGVVITPVVTSGILESITRMTFLELFRSELGVDAVERTVDRTELYVADEAFLCGTGAEIKPIASVDQYPVGQGEAGPLTKSIRQLYHDIVQGENPRYAHWLTEVA